MMYVCMAGMRYVLHSAQVLWWVRRAGQCQAQTPVAEYSGRVEGMRGWGRERSVPLRADSQCASVVSSCIASAPREHTAYTRVYSITEPVSCTCLEVSEVW